MNPVDLINHPLRHSDIDYEFRPSSYWEPPAALVAAVLRNVKGTGRRAMIRDLLRQGRPAEVLPELTYAELSQEVRERLCRIHPSFIGEDYLSGDRVNEVLIFRMEFPETVNEDSTSVWARPVGRKKPKIEYRVVDGYRSEFTFRPRRSNKPLTLGQLVHSLDNVKHIEGVGDLSVDEVWLRHGWVLCYIECNRACSDDGDSVPLRDFMTISSDVYPDLARHYGRLIDRWVNAYALSKVGDKEAAG
jgi:hypothetical protein